MGGGPVLTCAGAVAVDHAIFTSIRSPMGEGYRIVASSAGVRADERTEITRCSPSHGSLCDPGPSAEALGAYRLSTGRYCIAWSRHAGREHTARGGERVYTQIALLDPDGYAAFGWSPLRVRDALRLAAGPEPRLKPPAELASLTLAIPGSERLPGTSLSRSGIEPQRICAAAESVLAGRVVIVAGFSQPFDMLEWTLSALPASTRSELTLSVGLKISSARRVRIAWIGPDRTDAQRALAGQDLTILGPESTLPTPQPDFAPWLTLVCRCWGERRFEALERLTSDASLVARPSALQRITALSNDLDAAATADPPALGKLRARWGGVQTENRLEQQLVAELLEALDGRAEILKRQQGHNAARPPSQGGMQPPAPASIKATMYSAPGAPQGG